jgi:hypothetical protein
MSAFCCGAWVSVWPFADAPECLLLELTGQSRRYAAGHPRPAELSPSRVRAIRHKAESRGRPLIENRQKNTSVSRPPKSHTRTSNLVRNGIERIAQRKFSRPVPYAARLPAINLNAVGQSPGFPSIM